MIIESRSMKVAIFTGSSITSFGGGERGAIELANELIRRGIYVVIFTPADDSKKKISLSEIHGMCRAEIVRFNKLPFRFIPMIPFFSIKDLRYLKKMKAIYNIDESLFTGLFLSVYSRFKKIKYIYGMHIPDSFLFSNHSAQSKFKKKAWYLYRIPLQVFFKVFVKNIHVINTNQLKSLHSIRFNGNMVLIPDFVYRNPEKIVFNDSKFVVLFTGVQSIEIKGVDLLVDIISSLLQKERDIKFYIAGGTGDGTYLINELANKYPANIKNKGFVTEKELAELHREASLFIFTSRIDSFSLGIVWAQSYGLPCVAFNIPGPMDILTKPFQGSLITPFDTSRFSATILEFYIKWKTDRVAFNLLRNYIQNNIYNTLGADIILPKIINLFSECE